MQASLCHRTTSLSVKNHHFQHPVRQAIHRDCQLALNFSPLFGNGLQARPSRTIINPAIRAHLNPPDSGINKSKEEYERTGIAKSTVAAVVFVCTLGAMCTNLTARAQWWSLPRSPPPVTTDSDHADTSVPIERDNADTSVRIKRDTGTRQEKSSPADHADTSVPTGTIQEKSIQALLEIFEGKLTTKPAPTPTILLDSLRKELPKDADEKYLDQLKTIEKAKQATKSLHSKWNEMPQGSDQYNLGLVLIDLLIHQGDYKEADTVCKKIESYAPPSDMRPQIRRAIIKLMLLVGETEKTARILKAETLVLESLELIRGTKSLGPPTPTE